MKRLFIVFLLSIPVLSYSQGKFDLSLIPGIDFVIAQKEWSSPGIPGVQSGTTYKELNENSYFDISGDFTYNFDKMFSAGVSIGFMNLVEYQLYSFQAMGRIKLYDKKVIPFVETKFGFNTAPGESFSGGLCFTFGAGAIIPVSKVFGFKAGINYKYINPESALASDIPVGNEQNSGAAINASLLNLTIGVNFSL